MVMALSTTFMQRAPETYQIRQNNAKKAISPTLYKA